MKYSKEQELQMLFEQAVEFHHKNELDQACKIYTTLLDEVPESPIVLFNLGLVLYQQGYFEESEQCYRYALEIVPGENDILYNLALCLKRQERYEEVIDIYNHILENNPKDIDSLYNLGCCLKDMHRDHAAMEIFGEVLTISEDYQSAASNLAYLYHKHGETEKAQKVYQHLLDINPDHLAARHMLNSLLGITTESMPKEYVANVFDDFSDCFEERLLNDLGYRVPQLLKNFYDRQFPNSGPHHCLDLGCGTGLTGQIFKDECKSLTGVDISPKMLDIASKKDIYSKLDVADIYDFINNSSQRFSLIVAADVFPYFGKLDTIFSNMADISTPGCILCFSVEQAHSEPYILRKTGRFAHSKTYIQEKCQDTGWDIVELTCTPLRKEKDKWIEGFLVLTQNKRHKQSTQ